MSEIVIRSSEVKTELEKLQNEFFNCNSDRSIYQIEKFVIGQNDTEERQYLQVVTELHMCYMEIKRQLLDYKETEIALAELLAVEQNPRIELAINRIKLKQESLEYSLDAKIKEFNKFIAIKKRFPQFTVEEIERAEAKYYECRLERQALEDKKSQETGISVGNLRALEQANITEKVLSNVEQKLLN